MYRKLDDFFADWKAEEKFTINIFLQISDDTISQKIAENIRSLGQLAWHITQTLTEMPYKAGIIEKDYLENEKMPARMNEIIKLYKKHSEEMIKCLRDNWTDSDLFKVIEVYGQKWEKQKILSALINHQIHHRAQMTVLMRMQNLLVPGIYGPSKEEWIKYGMIPPE